MDIDEEEVVQRYENSETVTAIARALHCRTTKISVVLQTHGVVIRRGPARRFTEDDFCPKSFHFDSSDMGTRKGQFYCKPCYTDYQRNKYWETRRTPEKMQHRTLELG
jgi:hypothetical protein